jgi:hypothetical protein
MRWFRLYDDVLNDPKVQKLSGETFKLWINVLCIASKHGGVLPSLDDLAFQLRLPTLVCKTEIDTLKAAGLIDGDKKLKPHGWEKRQYKSDTSTERVKRFRERSSNVAETVNETVPDTDTETKQSKKTNQKSRFAGSAEFDRFWSLYPRREGKGNAAKAWPKAIAKASPEHIIQKLEEWQGSKGFPTDAKFVPLPASWLNAERWSDEMEKDESIFGNFGSSGTNKEEEIERIRKEMAELWQNQ